VGYLTEKFEAIFHRWAESPHRQGTIGATRNELDWWVKTLPQPWMVAMEATMFTGWVYDHLLPHAA